jgi:hypothetical protein
MANMKKVNSRYNDTLSQAASADLDTVYALIGRIFRVARNTCACHKPDEFTAQPSVQFIIKRFMQLIALQPTHFGKHTDDEYTHKEIWSLEQAICLTVGMDPFYFAVNPEYYNNQWRNKWTQVKASAARHYSLPVTIDSSQFYIEPSRFCDWALATVEVDETIKVFFTKVKKELHPSTFGAFFKQLEFDFGPDFSSPATELDNKTNSTLKQPSSPCEQDGFIGFKEDTE